MQSKPRAIVIGSGFAGLASASYLAKDGYEVTVLEKHDTPGGRARKFSAEGFTFDMGPSWYWMPDVFESYFADFDHKVEDFYDLIRLDPSYRVYFGTDDHVDLSAELSKLYELFDSREPGAGAKLKEFLDDAKYKYEVGIKDLVHKPGRSIFEFADVRVLKGLFQLNLLNSIKSFIRKSFKDPKLIEILEFPVLFLGAMPKDTPALYSLMNYADMALGTWYPKGGMNEIVQGMYKVAKEQGVNFEFKANVTHFSYEGNDVTAVHTDTEGYPCDVVVAGADYHHVDQKIVDKKFANYTAKYWEKRKMAPSSLLYYIGLDTKIPDVLHHNLFFDADFNTHAECIYDTHSWPVNPLFYLSVVSKTDPSSAPEGCENVFILIPTAPGLEDSKDIKEHYYNLVMDRLKNHTGIDLREHVIYRRDFAYSEFVSEYNSFKGNAYGLANTLDQTALLKPSLKNKKLSNLYYTGQLTTPGPGVPPSLISGQVVAREVVKDQKHSYESTV